MNSANIPPSVRAADSAHAHTVKPASFNVMLLKDTMATLALPQSTDLTSFPVRPQADLSSENSRLILPRLRHLCIRLDTS